MPLIPGGIFHLLALLSGEILSNPLKLFMVEGSKPPLRLRRRGGWGLTIYVPAILPEPRH
jgi:hypothetical protein